MWFAQLLGVNPRECVVFEDSPTGAKAGVAAGAYVIGITTGQTPEHLRAVGGVHYTIADYSDPQLTRAAWFAAEEPGADLHHAPEGH